MSVGIRFRAARVREMRALEYRTDRSGKKTPGRIEIGGELAVPTARFWTSFSQRFGISDTIFRLFDPNEVLQRIAERNSDDSIRYCVELDKEGQKRLLAISSMKRGVTQPSEIVDLIRQYDGHDLSYHEGVLSSNHIPRSGEVPLQIGTDEFQNRFVLETPLDGFGDPRTYVSLLRLICKNGMDGYAPAFRSEIRVGNEALHSIRRALESFDNGEGYAALRQRVESAQNSWASGNEVQGTYWLLAKHIGTGKLPAKALERLDSVAGNIQEHYGLANLEALSVKKQRVLPAKCMVYDLLNLTSELATHHAQHPATSRALQAHVGSLVSDEFDMEGTAENSKSFADFFVDPGPTPVPSLN